MTRQQADVMLSLPLDSGLATPAKRVSKACRARRNDECCFVGVVFRNDKGNYGVMNFSTIFSSMVNEAGRWRGGNFLKVVRKPMILM